MVGLCGEFPSGQLNRLIESDSYAEKVVTDLKQSKLIRTHYKDGLRGYRLTKRAKELLLSQNSCRFQNYLTGNAETNLIRSELPRRLRLHQKAETYLTLSHAGIPFFPDEKPLLFSESGEAATFPMRSLPLFYSSREIKNLGASTTKIKNSRSMGILMAPHCVYAVYNTGNTLLKWEYKTEVRLNAFLQHYLQGLPYHGPPTVYKLLTMSSEKELNSLFDLLPVSHPAKVPYCIYKQASDTVRSGVIIGLGARLQVFQNKLIRQITSYDEIDLTLPGKQKCAYFCITSDQDSTFDFLSSLFMTFIFIKLVRYADKYGEEGKLPVAVHILADELANTGAILELNKKISVIRSRNLSISCIFQNLPQMQNRYPYNQWQEIIGNCDTQLFLGCTDEVTATFISNRSGDVTVGVSSEAKQLNSWRVSDYTPEYRQTKSIGKRKLLTPDEILRLPLDTALVILRGQKVLKVEKYDYTLHPDAKKLIPRKASEHIPEWRKNGSSEETDYRPQPSSGSSKRKRRSSSASIAKQKPHFTSDPVYQEPTPDDFMEDFLQENFIEDSPDSGMVPLDKDSIMS